MQRASITQLVNHIATQLQTGCGNPDCTTTTCYTYKTHILPQARRYNAVTARAMAIELATMGAELCPYLQVADLPTEVQQKIDQKSLIQQLSNTQAVRLLHPNPAHEHLFQTTNLDNPSAQPDRPSEHVIGTLDIAIHKLIALVPRAQPDNWNFLRSTAATGRAYGKQRHRTSHAWSSPWLHILDIFEDNAALGQARRLVEAISSRTFLEEQASGEVINDKAKSQHSMVRLRHKVRNSIVEMLVEDEKNVRAARSGRDQGYEHQPGKSSVGTSSFIWLEWLRRSFLKHWDGGYRLDRWGVAGAALELMEDLWEHRDGDRLNLPDDLFATAVVFDTLNIDNAAKDWLEYQDRPNTRHVLSFSFLFNKPQSATLFRMMNHINIRHTYSKAGAVHKMRLKATPRASLRNETYLDQRMKSLQEAYVVLRINRHSVLSDANDQLWHRSRSELAKPLRVRMGMEEGEIGHDLGGVQIEFFKLACMEALDPAYAMFSTDTETNLSWFQPASMVPLYKYELFGTIFALALYNGVTLPVSFPLVLYTKLLGRRIKGLNDVMEGWPTVIKSLRVLSSYDGDVEEDLAKDYTFSFMANGLHVEVDASEPSRASSTNEASLTMKVFRVAPDEHHPQRENQTSHTQLAMEPTSSKTPLTTAAPSAASNFHWPGWDVKVIDPSENPPAVTNANRQNYVSDYMQWLHEWSVHPQYSAFARGFHSVIDPKALELLTPEKLRAIVEGDQRLDIDQLKRAATYRGYSSKSPIVRWFWELVREYPEEKQKRLLEFVTASNRVPVNGAANLTFVIEKMIGDADYLPGSSTCFSTLRLPDYASKNVLQRKLDIALQHSLGFGQA